MTTDTRKKRTYASNALLYSLFIVGAIVVVNLLGTRVFGRVDLTENDVYTLSQASKDLVKKLPDYMTVKAFISSDLPPELKTVSRYVRDLVDEYKSSSNGKFRWDAVDPGTDKKLEEEANRCKVQQVQIQVLRNQKFELGAYYLGLCLQYGNEVESIPQVVRAEGLEYQMSSLIKKLTTKKKKIAFTTGHGESDSNQGFQSLKGALEQEFELTTVNPSQAEIGKDVDALVVGGPKQPFDEKAQKEIDKFVMEGKGVVFMIDGITLQAPGGMAGQAAKLKMGQPTDSGLGKVLEAYGFKVNQDFVFDLQNAPGVVDINGRQMLANLPTFVAAETLKDKELTVLDGVRGVVFPYASSVELAGPLKSGKPAKGKLWALATSSKDSWKHTGFFVLGPGTKFDPPPADKRGTATLGFAYQGPLHSAFAAANAPAVSDPNAPVSDSKRPVRVVVIGDSDFANDENVQLARFLSFYGAGAQLLVNSIAWTVEDEALTPLRSKNVIPRPIKVASEAAATAIQWSNILGLPLAFCVFGVLRWRFRRASRFSQKL